ncbi:MAG: sulfatase-like hydrolase/transferase [Planctomycetales bacterium]|nr:sulfatase-like hydrolase/transferase [Planctomycetales bacterium]
MHLQAPQTLLPKRFLPCLLVMGLLASIAAMPRSCAAQQAEAGRPNILFIMSDDHGYQAIGAYGSRVNQTPNIDRIAKEGMRFDRCFVTNSICGPSRAVILTGKYSHLNGFIHNGSRFNGEQQTVAKLLQKAGYTTAVVGKWHLVTNPTGFDYWHILRGQGPYYNPQMLTSNGDVKHEGYTTEIITDVTLEWLKEGRDKSKPFFLVYQHKAPHRNWQPGPKYLNHYDDVEIPEPETLWDNYEGRGSAAKTQAMTIAEHLTPNDLKLVPQGGLTPEQRKLWDAAYGPKNEAFKKLNLEGEALVKWKYQRYAKDYLRCVDAVDDNVGRVLDYLDETGLADNTMVVYTSDQGWYLGEHGWYDKRWMYEESFRTPLLIRWPGKVKPGTVSNDLCLNLDFPETFLELAGLPIPGDMQGRSLVPVLTNQPREDWRKSIYYHYYEFPGAHSVQKHYGVRTDRYKLIHFYEIDEWELYDLEADKHELKSVYDDPDYATVRQELEAELKRLRDQYKDDGSVVNHAAAKAKEVKLQQVFALESATLNGDGVAAEKSSRELDPAYKPLVVGAWSKPSASDGVLVAQGGESLGYSLYIKGGRPHFAVRVGGKLTTISARQPVAVNEWTHLAGVLDVEGKAQLLVNGKPMARRARNAGLLSSPPADSFHVGADRGSLVGDYDNPLPFRGELKDVRVYWGQLPEPQLNDWVKAKP